MECRIGEGPCLDAIAQRPTFESADLREQQAIWPTFTANAIDAGIHSMLAFRLFAAQDTLGALDLYGRPQPDPARRRRPRPPNRHTRQTLNPPSPGTASPTPLR